MSERSGGSGPARWAVVLAAGRGTRLQRPADVALTPEQESIADRGLKALMPIHGHPYAAYGLSELARAGFRDVCVVVGPGEEDPVRAGLEALPTRRLRLSFAVQAEPRGAADAVLAAEPVVGDDPFVMLNADNIYPAKTLERLRTLDGSGLPGFDPDALVARSNIPPDRVAAYALLRTRGEWLDHIVEKPDEATAAAMAGALVSMNCWRFQPGFFDACQATELSPRGELEVPGAVSTAMERGERFRVLPAAAGVLDLSVRTDVPALQRWLAGRKVEL